jgi:N-acetylneuraminic acid mutarotase
LATCGLACGSAARDIDGSGVGIATDAAAGDDAGAIDDGAADAEPGIFAWSQGAPSPQPRFEANGAVIDGQLWVMGGFTASTLQVTRKIDIYDPATDSWRPGPDLPGAETHIGVATVGRDIIVVGGFSGTFSNGPRPPDIADVWRWSAADGVWNPGPPLPGARAAFACALLGHQLHVAGGLGPDGASDAPEHFVWDITADPSSATWVIAAPLLDARNHGGGAALGGSFYAVAGRHQWNELSGDVPDLNQFDPASGAWIDLTPIPTPRSEIAASTTAMSDGRLLVIGGSTAGVTPNSDVLVYDPAQDTWTALPSLPERRKGAVAARIGRSIIVTTGSPTSVDPSATTFVGCCF